IRACSAVGAEGEAVSVSGGAWGLCGSFPGGVAVAPTIAPPPAAPPMAFAGASALGTPWGGVGCVGEPELAGSKGWVSPSVGETEPQPEMQHSATSDRSLDIRAVN